MTSWRKGDTVREAETLYNRMQELESAFMPEFWNGVLLRFHAVSKALQEEKMDLEHVHI